MKVCFTGGGTGGHVFPAFAVDVALYALTRDSRAEYDRFWIGSHTGYERKWVEDAGFRFLAIRSGKLRRYLSWRNIADLFGIVAGFMQALAILGRERPDVLFSKGGYVSVPPVFAARILGIPVVTHESDATPGLATLLDARAAKLVCIPFEGAQAAYPKRLQAKLAVTGVPTRCVFARADARRARERFGLSPGQPVTVILGGSQGALQINELVWQSLDELLRFTQVVHQTGEATFKQIERPGYCAVPFIDGALEDVLASATLVVSRAGATALADYMEMHVPMMLIPLGLHASRGDQLANAKRLEMGGAAIVLEGTDIGRERFIAAVRNTVSHAIVRQELVQNASAMHVGDAAERIARVVWETVKRR